MNEGNSPGPTKLLVQNTKNVSLKNWHVICRSCLCEIENDHFSMEETYLDRKLFDIYENVTSLKFEPLHPLPKKLCPTCYQEIIRFDRFKNNALESERLLLAVNSSINENLTGKLEIPIKAKVEGKDSEIEAPLLDNFGSNCEDDSDKDHKIPVKSETKFLVCDESANEVPKIRKKRRKIILKADEDEQVGRNEKEVCSECGKEVLAYRIQDHMRTHTKEKPFNCSICEAKFADRSNLRRHVKLHLNYRPFVCEICGKDFIRPSSKKIHMLTVHKQEKDVFCPVCKKAFKHKMFLKKHMASVHNKSEDPSEEIPSEYPCVHCDKIYKFKSSLYAHEKRHVDPRPFLCNTCGKSFTTKAIMQNHERIHTGEMIYDCSVCDRKFRTLSTLKTHELVHKGEKPLSCQFCDKQFRQHAHLKTHIRGQHNGERPYNCDYCGKSFKQSSNLRVHIRLHTGETPFHCGVCGKGFYDSSRLKRHNKRHDSVVIKFEEKNSSHDPKEEPYPTNNWLEL
ncbi:zinc finger protein OZF-like [Anthonomus grandis grandis]|uniref:zinc finger protein OZF-like n=1 Tax=Anthonomus grandis grandis TaxID=2921223 RepID=UPI0021663D7C|nr:zinc finger protein OZF-like [Anthonomus grandis grandis]